MKKAMKYAFAALAVSALSASATLIPLNNASFDNNVLQGTWSPQTTFMSFPGRTTVGGITTASLAPNDGTGFASLSSGVVGPLPGDGDSTYHAVSLTAGQEYKLTFAVATSSADNADDVDTTFAIAVYTSGWGVFAESAWQTLAQDGDTWSDFSYTFTADADADFNIGIRNYTDPASGSGTLYVDNARFEAIPEPATMGLVALFGGAILFVRRKLTI